MSITAYENAQTTTGEDLESALQRLENMYALTEAELEYLRDGETVLWEEDGQVVEIVITKGD